MRRALGLLVAVLSCSHAQPAPAAGTPPAKAASASDGPAAPSEAQAKADARALSDELHALLREEAERVWTRWTTGAGPLPSGALAQHPRLFLRESLAAASTALAHASTPEERLALRLLHAELATLAVSREAAPDADDLERARASLAFAAPGERRPEHSERDLDRLLTDEANAQKRQELAQAEAKAAKQLAPLALARDAAVQKAIERLGLPSWAAVVEELHGATPAQLADLAERTLTVTEAVARKAMMISAAHSLGVTPDRVRRADLPRLVRSAAADSQFTTGKAWPAAKETLAGMGLDPTKLPNVKVDLEPSPSKGPRPLALLVDPPGDVRLSLRPTGGFEEQRAVLHESARALGGALSEAPRWEIVQLGSGSAAEGVAQVFQEVASDPAWLREHTGLRGEPLDDLVHVQAARRLLAARRAAALVLFEVKRREGPQTAEANAALYKDLLQRATLATMTDDDAGRWALETDDWIRAATQLEGALFGAGLEDALDRASPKPASAAAGGTDGNPAASTDAGTAPKTTMSPKPTRSTKSKSKTVAKGSPPKDPPPPPPPPAAEPATGSFWHAQASADLLMKIWAKGRSANAMETARLYGATQLDPAVLAQVADRRLAYSAPDAPPPAERPDYSYMQGDKKVRKRKKHRKK
ncbi:MAG: hypothetical protein ACJ787_10655 [Myxococcales bacterium]